MPLVSHDESRGRGRAAFKEGVNRQGLFVNLDTPKSNAVFLQEFGTIGPTLKADDNESPYTYAWLQLGGDIRAIRAAVELWLTHHEAVRDTERSSRHEQRPDIVSLLDVIND